jgi:hypothetical protein
MPWKTVPGHHCGRRTHHGKSGTVPSDGPRTWRHENLLRGDAQAVGIEQLGPFEKLVCPGEPVEIADLSDGTQPYAGPPDVLDRIVRAEFDVPRT